MLKKPTRGRPALDGVNRRDAIFSAAKVAFRELGYDQASIREIASRAGVDPKLVLHYFESKANLFAQTIEIPAESMHALKLLKDIPRGKWGDAFAQILMQPDGRVVLPHLVGVLRSATSDPKVAQTLREFYIRASMSSVLQELGIDHPEVRAATLSPLLAGFVFSDQILGIPIGNNAGVALRRKLFAYAIQIILTAKLD